MPMKCRHCANYHVVGDLCTEVWGNVNTADLMTREEVFAESIEKMRREHERRNWPRGGLILEDL